MVAQAIAEQPNECCGLLAGIVEMRSYVRVARALKRYPLVNEARSPIMFHNGGRDLFEATRDMRKYSMDTLAVYHSHPTSPPVPSRTDIEKNWGTGVMTIIVSLATTPPTLRGWWLEEASYREAEWEVVD